LPRRARAFRLFHAAWSVVGLLTLAHIWFSVVTKRRDRILPASVGFLVIEGVALGVGGGDCPLGPFQRDLGDPVPFFELVLPPRAAKAAIPILAVVSVLGIALIGIQELSKRPS
jgi:hypothetical protein